MSWRFWLILHRRRRGDSPWRVHPRPIETRACAERLAEGMKESGDADETQIVRAEAEGKVGCARAPVRRAHLAARLTPDERAVSTTKHPSTPSPKSEGRRRPSAGPPWPIRTGDGGPAPSLADQAEGG